MNKIDYRKDKIPFTQVANSVLNDDRISFRAKGIYAYLYSKPDGWDFAVSRIAKDSSEGRVAVNNGLLELEEFGYLYRKRLKTGRMEYTLSYSQVQKKPLSGKAKEAKSQCGKTCTVSNKDKEVIKSISNKELATKLQVDSLITAFKDVNPTYKSFYPNKTQRKACKDLLNLMEEEKLLQIISKVLPISNHKQYSPTITTPLQLFQKFAQLESFLQKTRLEDKKKIIL